MGPILGTIKSVPRGTSHAPLKTQPGPFITICRQPGSSTGWKAANQLLVALNAALPGEQPWTCWDGELIDKVALDLKIPPRVAEVLEERAHSWFTDFFEALSFSDIGATPDEHKVYARVSKTIRALAEVGRVVIVGRGGVFLTHDLPGGIHINLVAPLEYRVANIASELNLTPRQAAARIKKMEHERELFYRQHWSKETMNPETFDMTINTAKVDVPTAVVMITALARRAVQAAKK
jgi:cytidylate kinase